MSKNEVVKLTRTRLRCGALCGLIFVQVDYRGDVALLYPDGSVATIFPYEDHLLEVTDGEKNYIAKLTYGKCVIVDPHLKGANFLRPVREGKGRCRDNVLYVTDDSGTAEYAIVKHYLLCWKEAEE